MNLSKKKREEIRQMFGGQCAYCGILLSEKGWHADHVKAVIRKLKYVQGYYEGEKYVPSSLRPTGEVWVPENDTEENLFPSCRACNIHKGPFSLESWRKELEDVTGILKRGYPTYRHAVRFGQVVEKPGPIVFWFEKYQYHGAEAECPN